jgi:4-hydroxybenzoate polyprenyltransferase
MSSLVPGATSCGVVFARAGFSVRGILAGLAMCALTAFGFQVNDILDFRKDRSAGVKRPIAAGAISRSGGVLFALVLLAFTFALSAWIGIGGKVLALTALALVLYTPSARKLPLIKGLYVAGLCLVPLYYGSQVGATQYPWQPYALMAMFIVGREALMDSSEIRGDRSAGMVTVAVLFGETRSKWGGIWVMALSLVVLVAVSSGRTARLSAAVAVVALLCVFVWPRLDDGKRIELTRIPMLAAALAIACGQL